jgi:ATP-binding cassette subfamily F protein uup
LAKAAKQAAAQEAASPAPAPASTVAPAAAAASAPAPVAAKARKLSYKEQRELDELPARIAALEKEQAELAALLAGSELYSQGAARIAEVTTRHAQLDELLLELMERWEALGSR